MNDFIQTWWPVFTTLAAVCALGVAFWVRTEIDKKIDARDYAKQIETTRAAATALLQMHSERIIKLESLCEALPRREHVDQINKSVMELVADVRSMGAKLSAVQDNQKTTQASVQRINDYLLNEKAG